MQKITPTIKPEPKQHLAYEYLYDNVTSYVGFGGGAGGGKTWLGAEWLMTNCYRYPESKWFLGRNELTRLLSSSFITFQKVCKHHDIPKEDWRYNGQYHYIQFNNGSRIDLLDLKYLPSDPEYQRYGSSEYTGGWIEEAGEVHILAFDVLKTRIGRHMNNEYGLFPAKLLCTFNPAQNWLYRVFYKPWRNKTLPKEYSFVQSLYKDNHYTADTYGKQLDQISDPILKARLKLGLWEYVKGNSLCEYDALVDMFTNTIDVGEKKYLTADVARFGSDKIIYGIWQGLELERIVEKQKQGTDVTATDIRTILAEEKIPFSHAVIDEEGVGGGVVDNLRGVKGFVGNSPALKRTDKKDNPKENYRNLRAQCSFMLAEKVNEHEISITHPVTETVKEIIIEDLQQIKRKEAPQEAPLQIIPKDEIKEALGRSPDYGDTIMMRMYFELDRKGVMINTEVSGGIQPYYAGLPG